LDFRILGPLEVDQAGRQLALEGRQQRALLALLLLHANEVVPVDTIIDELWAEAPPPSATRSVHALVSRLRRLLEDEPSARNGGEGDSGVLLTRSHGYLLRVAPGELDLDRFESLLGRGRNALAAGQADMAAKTLREALAIWRGPPLAEFAYDSFAVVEIARLNELRLSALEERIDADLAAGRSDELVAELEALVATHPLRERLRGQLMLALYRCDRQANALQVYQDTRRMLVGELGIEPSQGLQRLEQAILRHEESLEPPMQPAADRARLVRRRAPLAGIAALVAAAAVVGTLLATRREQSPAVHVLANSLAVIDPRSDEVVSVVPVGARPGAVAFGSGALWVAILDDRTVQRIDPETLAVTRTIPVGDAPTALAATTDDVWAAGADGAVRRIDPRFGVVAGKTAVGRSYYGPLHVSALAVTGMSVWAVGNGGVSRFGSAKAVETFKSVAYATAADIGPGGLWVTSSFPETVSRIDPVGVVTATIPVGHGPVDVAAGTDAVWVVDSLDDAVLRIDPETNAVATTIAVGRSPSAIAVGLGSVWVANSGDGTVSRIDPAKNSVVDTIDIGGSPQAITVAAGRVWVSVQAAAPTNVRSGGTLRVNVRDTLAVPEFSIDPATDYLQLGWQIAFATCAKLFNYPDRPAPEGSIPQPEVARSPPRISPDRRTYTFTIRPGFRFSPPSNQPVTAASFKFAIERSLSPRLGASGWARIGGFLDDIVGAKAYEAGRTTHVSGIAVRGNRLTIRLTDAAPSLLARLAMPFFCAVPTDTPLDSHGAPVPSAGPYYVSSYTPKQQLVLERNPNYAGPRPHRLRRIVFTLGVNPTKSVKQIESGTVDYTDSVPPTHWVRLAARYGPQPGRGPTKARFLVNPTATQYWVALNTSRPLFRSTSMRRAVSYAVDRRALARQGSYDAPNPLAVQPSDQYLPVGFPGSVRASIYPLDGDIAMATRLANGRRGTAILYACNSSPCPQVAQILKKNLHAIGIDAEVKLFNTQVLYDKIGRRGERYDLAVTGWNPDYLDPSNYLNDVLSGDAIDTPTHWNAPLLDDPTTNRKLREAARLLAPERYEAYGRVAVDLARNAAPLVAYGTETSQEFFSARVGCQLYQPASFGVDLAALCLRRSHRRR